MKLIWREEDFRDKAKAIEAKKDQLDQHFAYEENLKKRQNDEKQLKNTAQNEKEEIVSLKAQVGYLTKALKDSEEKRSSDIGQQLKYTQANESVLHRTQKRLEVAEKTLKDMHFKMAKIIGRKTKGVDEKDQMAIQVNQFAFVLEDFETVMDSYQDLMGVRRNFNSLTKEKNYILQHMGYNAHDISNIKLQDAYRDYVAANEQKLIEMEEQTNEAKEALEDQKELLDTMTKEKDVKNKWQMGAKVWQGAILTVMRNQLQDVKKENRMKDTRLKTSETEIIRLRTELKEMEHARKASLHAGDHGIVRRSSTPHVVNINMSRLAVDYEMRSVSSASSYNAPPDVDDYDTLVDAKTEAARIRALGRGKQANNKHKTPTLPPLKPVYQLDNNYEPPATPRKLGSKPRNLGSMNRNAVDRNFTSLPNGLTTAPMQLKQKRAGDYNALPHGMSSMNAMGGKSKFEKALAPAKVRY